MNRQTKIIIYLIVVIGAIALVSWLVWPRPLSPKNTAVQDQPTFLADEDYQRQVSSLLTSLETASQDSWNQQLATSLASLQDLKVSSKVKYDHLLLFTALDLWQADNLTTATKTSVKNKLQIFASHQPWSQATIDSLITKGNLAS